MDGPIAEALQCYSLPYGGIGFASHLLTIYTAFALSRGRTPFAPWRKVQKFRWDIAVSFVGLIATVVTASIVMAKCRARWELVLIAAWKLVLSLSFGALSGHTALVVRAFDVRKNPTKTSTVAVEDPDAQYPFGRFRRSLDLRDTVERSVESERKSHVSGNPDVSFLGRYFFWYSLFVMGSITGGVGIFSLAKESWHLPAVQRLTVAFGVLAICLPPLLVYFSRGFFEFFHGVKLEPRTWRAVVWREMFVSLFLLVGILQLLFSDWILASLVGRYSGAPDGNNSVIFWVYFAAKRLPTLSL